jgi:hypothetical protein
MALLFMDGFDHYATADITKKWTSSASMSIASTSGRRGGGCASTNSLGSYLEKALSASSANIVVGFAFKLNVFNTGYPAFLTLKESSTSHISLGYNASSKLEIRRGNGGGTLLATSNASLSLSQFNYIEIKVTISDTVGTTEVRINGVTDSGLTLTGADTRNGGTSGVIDLVSLGQNSTFGAAGAYDDLYVCDTSGSTNNNFLGDCRIDTLFPNADGNYSQFTPSTGTVHYSLVDESTPNTTDYNYSSTSGDRDSYTFPDLTGLVSQTVYGIQINAAALKSDSGSRSLGTMSRLSGTNKDGTGAALSTSLAYLSEIQETDPASAAWTEANVNAAEFGVKVTA